MRVNVDKVLERDQKLSELDDRADALQAGASQFETSAAKLKRKYWWKNLKLKRKHWWKNLKVGNDPKSTKTAPKSPKTAPKWAEIAPKWAEVATK
ncbi:hypothetical protein DV515_00019875 [Chloebia gouldiae]|uniref:V-SNARE coiled-coil homology domain-containing protein n=1 Tax=Chloebia gouldiae TaxID=44316 RepID=A0A3L8Q3J1_CHLGU|nr:hypothetical protein DV515_00019875 [Chloebia gouldiae]